ncbi:MAG TPA: LpqB family beta-propeller domain-containing protein, partial [Streptosporangiaceae bacterium]|nr:LpqB family beta-propeller domain-containing protein [Streptosporangiaceae bacterium]
MARTSRRRTAGLAALITVLAVLVTGCVTVPTSGHVQSVNVTQSNTGNGQYYLQTIPVPPGPNWKPEQIVSGFLAANASFANNHAVARQYLTRTASQQWQPGLAVTVYSQISQAQRLPAEAGQSRQTAGPGTINVEVSGTVLGNLSGTGQYSISSRSKDTGQKFTLVQQKNKQWRITNLPPQVLLTQSDFVHVYQPRNIYFFDPAMQTLVPDPVYVPEEATPADLVRQLINDLIPPNAPSGWLTGAARTAFPPKTKLLSVSLDGGTAVVNVGGAAAYAGEDALHQMSAQLLWTLAGSSNDEPAIQSVELETKGQPWAVGQDNAVQQIGSYSSYVPSAAAHASFYYLDSHGAVRSQSGSAQANAPQGALVAGQAGTGNITLTQIAVSPDGRYVAGLGPGGALYTGSLDKKGTLTLRSTGNFGSLSWDRRDDLWVTGNGRIWMVPTQHGPPVPVSAALPAGEKATALKVAPDGVRCVILASGQDGARLLMAAIAGSGPQTHIGDPVPISADNLNFTAMSWYDADHVIALRESGGHPVLDEVSVNGENITAFPAAAGITSITADGAANPLVAGLSSGQLTTLATPPNGLWSGVVASGRAP